MTAPKQCRAMSSFDTDVMTHSTEWEAILPLELRLPALETIASIVSQALRLAPGITDPARLCDMALLSAYGTYDISWGTLGALAHFSTIPIVLLALVLNRYFVQGLTRGAH